MRGFIVFFVFSLMIFTISFSLWTPNLNSLNLPTYRTIGEAGIINYAFWVGLKLGLISREKGIFVLQLPLINLGKKAFSDSVFLQLNYSNSFVKGLHSCGITVVASVVQYNKYLIDNIDYDFLLGKYTKHELESRIQQYSHLPIEESKSLENTIQSYIVKIFLRSVKKLKLTTLPYKSVKVIGNLSVPWSDENASKTLSISSTDTKCDTLFIIGNHNVDLKEHENVFEIPQYNIEVLNIIKDIVLGDLADKNFFK